MSDTSYFEPTHNDRRIKPRLPFFEAHDGGLLSKDKDCIYFIGIIDILTFFG